MNKSIRKVRSALATITSMIDKWSMAYSMLVCVVGVVQVMVLRRLFNAKLGTKHLNVRI